MKNNENINKLLRQYIENNNLAFSDNQVNKILSYINLLLKWNKVYNLTNITNPTDILERHIFESLDVVKYIDIKNNFKIIDVGTGAGIPGIILAIACPDAKFYLCDIVDKKLKFLQQIIIELELKNCVVVPEKIESYRENFFFDIIISKAFSGLKKFLELTKHLSKEDTKFITFKNKSLLDKEKDDIGIDFVIDAIINQELVVLKKIK